MFPRTEYDRWCSFYGSWFQWKRKIQPRIQKNKYISKKLCQQSHVSYLNLKTILPRSLKHRLHWKKKKKKEKKKKKKPPWISYISNYSGVIFSLRYDGVDVPDTMNVHSIYDTSSSLVTYESREEYQKYIQQQAGVSGSYFGFSAGVKEAWGDSTASARQKYLAVMDVDVDR